ncbi:hypothetical protein F5146DRAFT_1140988 [Armillaria mellea]|nr:hypothetical protein F5146DRAFT_1140988 [Armillaria mellea]
MTTPLALPVTSEEMQCIFTIPELVTAIITEFFAMGGHSMDLIWRQIGDPSDIFRLLAPVEDRRADKDVFYDWNCSFKTLPMLSGWARLIYTDTDDIAVLELDSEVFLPNLIDFSWLYVQDDLWRDLVLFMHEDIETFTLMLELKDAAIYEPLLQYFEYIAAHQGHLKPALSWFLPKLQYLKVLEITPMLNLYDAISLTASLPNIEAIDARINKHMSRSLSFASPPTFPVILSSKLRSLSLSISYFGATTHLLCTEYPTMTKLSLQSYNSESPKATRTLTGTISLR